MAPQYPTKAEIHNSSKNYFKHMKKNIATLFIYVLVITSSRNISVPICWSSKP